MERKVKIPYVEASSIPPNCCLSGLKDLLLLINVLSALSCIVESPLFRRFSKEKEECCLPIAEVEEELAKGEGIGALLFLIDLSKLSESSKTRCDLSLN